MGEMKNIHIEIQNNKALQYLLHEINRIKDQLETLQKELKRFLEDE